MTCSIVSVKIKIGTLINILSCYQECPCFEQNCVGHETMVETSLHNPSKKMFTELCPIVIFTSLDFFRYIVDIGFYFNPDIPCLPESVEY